MSHTAEKDACARCGGTGKQPGKDIACGACEARRSRVTPPAVTHHLRDGRLHLAATCSGEPGCVTPPAATDEVAQ